MTVGHPQFGLMCEICFSGLTPERCAEDQVGAKWDICKGDCACQAGIVEKTPTWPIPENVRNPDFPDHYLVDDVDEMTTVALGTLSDVRRLIEAELAGDSEMARRMTALIDDHARQIRDEHLDDDD